MLWSTLVFSALACGLTWWLLRRQLFPVLATVDSLAGMANDSAPLKPLPVPDDAEIGELVVGVNRVLKTLELRETALQESEAFRRAIIDSIFAEIAVLDRDGVITAVNQPWERFAMQNSLAPGVAPPHIGVGTNYLANRVACIGCGEDESSLQATQGIRAVLDGRLPLFTLEYRCDAPNENRWFLLIVTPLHLPDGGAVVAHNNITERRQAQELTRNSEQRLTLMQQGANDGYWDWNLLANHMYYSPRWWSMLGYAADEMASDPDLWHRLMHPDDQNRVTQFFSDALADSTSAYTVEFRLQHKNGHYVPLESRGFIVRDPAGKAVRVSGANLDLSERKHAEAQLLTAKLVAETANAAKSRFLAAASHDLRQPLAALSLYVGILKESGAVGDDKLLSAMQDCVDSLSKLLIDILDISKLEAGAITPNPAAFELDDLLSKLKSINYVEAQRKGLSLRVRLSDAVVHTDRQLLHRLIGNLVDNAVQYTQSGGVLIAYRKHAGKQWVEVWDTGMGFDMQRVGYIFEEYGQIDSVIRRSGSGLGLAIVGKTASLLGLQLRVRSVPGRGSMFAVEVPAGAAPTPLAVPTAAVPVHGMRVALVEDNPQVLAAMTLALTHSRHTVIAASTGNLLMQGLAQTAPDIIITDYRLHAGETGYNVIAAVRAVFGDTLPALIITGDTDPDLIRAMAERKITVFYKPVQFGTLHRAMMQITRGTPA